MSINEFESPDKEEVEITLRGKTAKYWVLEVSGEKINELFAPLNSASTPEKKAKAAKESVGKMIAACVQRADGSPITFEEASEFRYPLQKRLQEEILRINALTADAEEEAKKE